MIESIASNATSRVTVRRIEKRHAKHEKPRLHLRQTPIGKALNYIAKYWSGLIEFLDDGRMEPDTNSVERTIRPIALNTKNALFAGHDTGAPNRAILIGSVLVFSVSLFLLRSQTTIQETSWMR